MRDDVIIKVENLSKTFKLYNHPKDRLKEALSPFRKKYHHEYHALKNISFEIKKGESVGILGKNGAGKSTLLKILTGVLTPSSGQVIVSGRVAALLELGAGFNPNMNGVENIYFQGAIIGFDKDEMEKKIPEIVEFADIGEFIHQPVKTYSSGMFARLAFSIAINVDPDILIVDEALSVGDARFQLKCISKMKSFVASDKTVIFVSHDLNQIKNFCNKSLWLKDNKIEAIGETLSVAESFFSWINYNQDLKVHNPIEMSRGNEKKIDFEILSNKKRFGDQRCSILAVGAFIEGQKVSNVIWGQRITFRLYFDNPNHLEELGVGIVFNDVQGKNIFTINTCYLNRKLDKSIKHSVVDIIFSVPRINPGDYIISSSLFQGTQENHVQLDWVVDSYVLNITGTSIHGTLGCVMGIDPDMIELNQSSY